MLLESPQWSKEGYQLTWEAKPLYSRRVTNFTDTNLSSPSPSSGSAVILSESDIPSSRCLFRLRLAAHHIEETGSSSSLMPTPTSVDREHRKRVDELLESGAEDMYSRQNGDARPNGLMDYLRFKGKTNPGVVKEKSGCKYGEVLPDTIGRLCEDSIQAKDGPSSRLSPLFTEEMMGFPFLWTTLPFLRESGEPSPSRPTEMP